MNARDVTLAIIATRAPEATVCPSEVARALAASAADETADVSWRSLMPTVHAAVDLLVAEGKVLLSWKGRKLPSRSGSYRIGRWKAD